MWNGWGSVAAPLGMKIPRNTPLHWRSSWEIPLQQTLRQYISLKSFYYNTKS